MNSPLDTTTLATISLLEARLLRIEHILFGATSPPTRPADTPTIATLSDLERRFAHLLSRFRVYAELLKIYNHHPTLFPLPPTPSLPPSQLPVSSLRSTVLSYATSFPQAASALTAASDSPIPDAAASAQLVELIPRMRGVEAVQKAQEAEIAELRVRSERVLRQWYEERVLGYGDWVADVEGRVEGVEAGFRRAERRRAAEMEV
ncbi:nuclear distribution protein [Coniochaeta sp. 2T2.1]|nr:nuclear distribution protein [Coniochaeta sp. 2T2.1]